MPLKMPRLVGILTTNYDAWVVGGAALPGVTDVRDWDVVVPFGQWGAAASFLAAWAKESEYYLNIFGGLKILDRDQNVWIDVWPDDLTRALTYHQSKAAWHPRSGRRWVPHAG